MTSPVSAPRSSARALPAGPKGRLRPDLHIVGPPTRRVRNGLLVGLVTTVVFAALFAGAVAHSLLVGGQVHLDQVGVDTRAARARLQTEQLTLAELQSPGRIAAAAGRLGMVPAQAQNWVSPGTGAASVASGGPGPSADAGTTSSAGTTSANELAAATASGGTNRP